VDQDRLIHVVYMHAQTSKYSAHLTYFTGSAMASADEKGCISSLHGGAFVFLDFILKNQVSENCSFSISIYEGSTNQIVLPFVSKMESNKISLSQFPLYSSTGSPGFNFQGKSLESQLFLN
jgi:hypothetical protein